MYICDSDIDRIFDYYSLKIFIQYDVPEYFIWLGENYPQHFIKYRKFLSDDLKTKYKYLLTAGGAGLL